MIPIVAISNFVNGAVALALVFRIFFHHRRVHAEEHQNAVGAHYFIVLYISIAVMWFLYAVPGIFVSDLWLITFTQIAANVFIYITAAIAMQITFISTNKKRLGNILSIVVLIIGFTYAVGEKLFALQYVRVISPPYVYWHPHSPSWLPITTGITAFVGTLIFIVTFLIFGLHARSNYVVYTRALHLAGGMTLFLAASIFYFILSNSGGLILTTLASLFGIIGLLVMLRGIRY